LNRASGALIREVLQQLALELEDRISGITDCSRLSARLSIVEQSLNHLARSSHALRGIALRLTGERRDPLAF
jgi:hypothetical protein